MENEIKPTPEEDITIPSATIPPKKSKKIVFVIIVLVALVAMGSIIYWQHIGIPKVGEFIKPEDRIANWKTYRNEKIGIQFKYPSSWEVISHDFPMIPEIKDVVFGKDSFVDKNYKVQFDLNIFQPADNNFSEDKELFILGMCNKEFYLPAWDFILTESNIFTINNIEILEKKGKIPEKDYHVFIGCYYFESPNKNLIEIYTPLFTDRFNALEDFEKVDSVIKNILSTLTLI